MLTNNEVTKKLRQCAEERGGKTPSEKIFYEYAGIGIHNLKKLGYSNYGELVKDAGLVPNKFDKTKYNNKQLCKLFILAIRKKGKWPTRGDLDVLHNKTSSFPDSSTFYKSLGLVKTGDLARKIIEYIHKRKGYNDIVSICDSNLEKLEDRNGIPDKDIQGRKHGWVYLLKSTLLHSTVYKIGKTNDLRRRVIELNQPSNDQELIHPIETDDPEGIESYWHKRFDNKRYKNKKEWFLLKPYDIQSFKRWKKIF